MTDKRFDLYGYETDEVDIRICFAIAWFSDEKVADAAAAEVVKHGDTYNGGWFHGRACGRDTSWDREVAGRKFYAVTF